MSENTRTCQVNLGPPVFVFQNPEVQRAANTVYEAKKAYDANPTNARLGRKYQFKTDYERMQYILGLYGRDSQGLR